MSLILLPLSVLFHFGWQSMSHHYVTSLRSCFSVPAMEWQRALSVAPDCPSEILVKIISNTTCGNFDETSPPMLGLMPCCA